MPQIPYESEIVPGTGQSGRGAEPNYSPLAPQVRIETGGNRFGQGVGAAIEHLGGKLETAGDEINSRAEALLQVKNEADADDAAVKWGKEVAEKHADFITKKGLNAGPEALAEYNNWLEQSRQAYANNMSSLVSRRMFESDSRRVINQNMTFAAGHSGEQLQQAHVSGMRAKIDDNINRTMAFPEDQRGYERGVRENDALHDAIGQSLGQEPATTQDEKNKSRADMLSGQIDGIRRTNPQRASRLYDENHALLGRNAPALRDKIDDSVRTVLSRNIAHNLAAGVDTTTGESWTAPDGRPITVDHVKKILGDKETDAVRGDRYSYVEPQASRAGFHALGKYGIMENELKGDLRKVGMEPVSRDVFLHSPDIQEELMTRKIQAAKDAGLTPNDISSMHISGKKYHDTRPDDPTDFPNGQGNNGYTYTRDFNARLNNILGLRSQVEAGKRTMRILAPNTPNAEEAVENAIESKWNHDEQLTKNDIWNARQTLSELMMKPLPDGTLPRTPEQITATPEGAQAWENTPESEKLTWLNKLKHNGDQKFARTADTMRQVDRLISMSTSDDPVDRQTFIDSDFTKMPLPADDINHLLAIRRKVNQTPGMNPEIGRAMGYIENELKGVGIDRTTDPESYHVIRGALQNLIQAQLDQHKVPDAKQIAEWGKGLISQEVVGRSWWGGSAPWVHPIEGTPTYKRFYDSLTDAEKQDAKQYIMDNKIYGEGEPTDQQVTSAALAKKFQEKHGLPTDSAKGGFSSRFQGAFDANK